MSSVSRSVGRPVTRSVLAGQLNNLTQLIKSLFSLGEQGFAYDPNDLTTLYQDAAGTVPVTAAGQPVGLMLDKSGRNNHASQTVSASRPILQRNATTGAYYLAFDGVDDFLVTNNIDFTATNKVSLFAGVRKLSDVGDGMLVESSPDLNSNNGAFYLAAPLGAAPTYSSGSKGTIRQNATAFGYNSPISNVIASRISTSLDTNILRVNATQVASSSADQGAGNYGNYPLFIGRRGAYSIPFNGHIYSLIGISRLTTDAETLALEKAIAKATGVTLNV